MIKPTGSSYLDTPKRQYKKMDHDFYEWRDTWQSPQLNWPDGGKVGVWLQVAVEWFPMNISGTPFLPIGAPTRPWPDSETYTQRDYGNRVGIFRMMDSMKALDLKASAFMNARVAQRYPILMKEILSEGWEVVAAGLDAGAIHHEGLSEAEERAMIAEVKDIFAGFSVAPSVWHSPSWSQSTRTPSLLLEAGFEAMADWCNDEAPYAFNTGAGEIMSLPTSMELSDREMIGVRKQNVAEVERSFIAAAKRMVKEAEESGTGRLLTLNVSPWLMGQPYRAATFERILNEIFSMEGVFSVDSKDILAAASRA